MIMISKKCKPIDSGSGSADSGLFESPLAISSPQIISNGSRLSTESSAPSLSAFEPELFTDSNE